MTTWGKRQPGGLGWEPATSVKNEGERGWVPSRGPGSPTGGGVIPGRFHAWLADGGDPLVPDLICLLGEDPPRLIRGLGGWEQVQRGGRRAGSYWPGGETPAFEINLWLENRVVETGDDGTREKMKALEYLCGGTFSGDEEPPPIRWAANLPLHDYATTPAFRWVCEDFDYGASVYDEQAGLLEQWATVVLAVEERGELRRLKRAAPFPRRTMQAGESLRMFAQRVLGDRRRWADIADLNRDNPRVPRSPDYRIKRSLLLAIPPREARQRRD